MPLYNPETDEEVIDTGEDTRPLEDQYGPGVIGMGRYVSGSAPYLESLGGIPEEELWSDKSGLSRSDLVRGDVDAAARTGEILQGSGETGKIPIHANPREWIRRKRLEAASPAEREKIIEQETGGKGPAIGDESGIELFEPNKPALSPGAVPDSKSVLNAPLPAPVAPNQAIPPPPGRPATSIKEYIALMREQGKTPTFTNISESRGAPQTPGMQGDAYFMPEKGRTITSGPLGYDERGTLDSSKPLGESDVYTPGGDPYKNATALAMQDAPLLWNKMFGNVPMMEATPDMQQRFTDAMMKHRDQLLPLAVKGREEAVKMIGSGVSPASYAKFAKSGNLADLVYTTNKDKMKQKDVVDAIIKNAEQIRKNNADMVGNKQLSEDEIQLQAVKDTAQQIEFSELYDKNKRLEKEGKPAQAIPEPSQNVVAEVQAAAKGAEDKGVRQLANVPEADKKMFVTTRQEVNKAFVDKFPKADPKKLTENQKMYLIDLTLRNYGPMAKYFEITKEDKAARDAWLKKGSPTT